MSNYFMCASCGVYRYIEKAFKCDDGNWRCTGAVGCAERFQKGLADDDVNNPKHYTSNPGGIECIQVVEHMGFCKGNAIKYIWRAGIKTEDQVKDLEKAIWYLKREIERIKKFGK